MHIYTITTAADRSLTAATPKTMLGWINPATRRSRALRFSLGFSSTTNTDGAVTVEIVRFTGADGTGSAVTPVPVDPGNPAAIATAKENYSAEPSTPVVLYTQKVTPQPGGTVEIPFDLAALPTAAVSNILGLRLTAPQSQSGIRATLWVEE